MGGALRAWMYIMLSTISEHTASVSDIVWILHDKVYWQIQIVFEIN